MATAATEMSEEANRWFATSRNQVRAVALVVHGLNSMPSRMDTLAHLLSENGIETYRMHLQGHGDSLDQFKSVSRERWLLQMGAAVKLVRDRAQALGRPAIFVGYSLGSLIYLDLVANTPGVALDRQILFAPPVSLRLRDQLIRLLNMFGPTFCVPSLSMKEYRANPCTPIVAYNALFESLRDLRNHGFAHVNKPTLVFIDPQDELVSYTGLTRALQDFHLDEWRINTVTNRESELADPYHHLIIDEPAVGRSQWNEMMDQLRNFLEAI